jgi:AcrR family transcriptional regulator
MAQTRITGAARREKLLEAAAEIVRDQGVAAVTMEAVALRNGVNRAMAYRYFADRDDLLTALLDREYERRTREITQQVDRTADFEGAMRFALRHWFEHGDLFMKLSSDTGPLSARAAEIRRADALSWGDAIARAFELPTDVAQRLAAYMVGGSYGVMQTRSGQDDEAIMDDILSTILSAGEAMRAKYARR